jgi:hypothetical protein
VAVESICSGCGKKLAVGEEHAGKRARCPACGQIYTVPFPSPGDAMPQQELPGGMQPRTPSASGNDPYATDPYAADPYRSDAYASATGQASGQPAGASGQAEELWMRAADGNVYGPVDRPTLDRWFREGRVGVGYQIRVGEYGSWTSPDAFRPMASTLQSSAGNPASGGAGNPYAPTNPYAPGGPIRTYPKADQSVFIIVMAILGFIICPIFSLIAWIMGANALKDIQAGQADPNNKGVIQAGYYLGMLNCILALLCIGGYFVIVALAIVGGAVN